MALLVTLVALAVGYHKLVVGYLLLLEGMLGVELQNQYLGYVHGLLVHHGFDHHDVRHVHGLFHHLVLHRNYYNRCCNIVVDMW